MIELIVVIWLARKNGQIAEFKGLSPTKYQLATAGLWFGGEFLGLVVGLLALGPHPGLFLLYVFGLIGAVSGVAAATYWVNQAIPNPNVAWGSTAGIWRPTHVAPATALPGWATPDGSQTPAAVIPPGAELVLVERRDSWARVRGVNGWTGWVDGRELQPTYGRSPARPSPEE
jgi:hypothetical protein